jgi:hypothetical protein
LFFDLGQIQTLQDQGVILAAGNAKIDTIHGEGLGNDFAIAQATPQIQAQARLGKAHDLVFTGIIQHAHITKNNHRSEPGQPRIH